MGEPVEISLSDSEELTEAAITMLSRDGQGDLLTPIVERLIGEYTPDSVTRVEWEFYDVIHLKWVSLGFFGPEQVGPRMKDSSRYRHRTVTNYQIEYGEWEVSGE